MSALDVPDLRRSGAVCASWRQAHKAFNLAALEKAPCLLYACEQYGPNDVAFYCPTAGATFRVPFPGQPHYKRGFTFSCSGGWVFTTDEVGNPYLLNPLTGVQATLPPFKTIYDRGTYYDDHGKHVWKANPDGGGLDSYSWARHDLYLRVAISSAAKVTECIVLIAHYPDRRLSFARPGDEDWTLLNEHTRTVCDVLYNDNDGLFYILYARGSISTLDLSGPSPSPTSTILPRMLDVPRFCDMYLAIGPSGQLLQVWREHKDTPAWDGYTYKDIMGGACEGCVDFAGENDNDVKSRANDIDEEEDAPYQVDTADQEIDASQLLREGIDMPHRLLHEVATNEILVFEVDTEEEKLVELREIGDYALFLGLNSAVCIPTTDFPVFEPNCAYITDDCTIYSPMLRKDLGVWNIKKRTMQKLAGVWPNLHPWLHLPAPIWIMPKF
ncbi:hypothetical protein QYE76_059705 [Lolium multiflorum]|uniref:KIB1-4 beta-propeller domain-containing protein n=1 Tax=Lolium multiflorum TaxID=4521 RepID=A0AAD8W4P8_LOLMU|nr:hypothetical protein QYE76_059705 [Lolium multiflorum]